MAEEVVIEPALVAAMLGQLNTMVSLGKWPLSPPPAGHLRGVDFYSANDFVSALLLSAQVFKDDYGYVPSLAAPVNFNEHIFARKFFAPLPLPSLGDKLAAKDYARARLGEDSVAPVVWAGEDIETLFAADLPAGRYWLKANHASGANLLLTLPDDLVSRREEITQAANSWLAIRYGFTWGEWWYCTFKPRLFLEPFLDLMPGRAPDDYKLYCFHGRARMINYHTDRFETHKSSNYDVDWNLLPFTFDREPALRERPNGLEAIVGAAEALAQGLEFARVDLYSDGSVVKFGEITFAPGNAHEPFSDLKYAHLYGRHFTPGAE